MCRGSFMSAELTGLEPAASCVTGRRSNQAELQLPALMSYKCNRWLFIIQIKKTVFFFLYF